MPNRYLSLLLMLFTLQTLAQEPLTLRWENFQKTRSANLNGLATAVAACVVKQDTSHPVFHGCYDWHSAVHGYWALLRVHRLQTNSKHLNIVEKAFTKEAMRQEFTFIRRNESFELPYGRAWFLLLISEFEQVTGNIHFQPFGDYVAGTLQQYADENPFNPVTDEYLNQSWLYKQLLNYYRYRNKHTEWRELAGKVNAVTKDNLSLRADGRPVFFSRWGNLAHLLSQTMTSEGMLNWEVRNQPEADSLVPVIEYGNAHHLAINYSRAWGFWSLYEKTSKPVYLRAYLNHLEEGLSLHSHYRNDYRRYGHWVPQFGIYAISLSDP